MALGMDGDDEESIMRFITNWIRSGPIGYGMNLPVEVVAFLWMCLAGNGPAAVQKGGDLLRPFVPSTDLNKAIMQTIDYMLKGGFY